MFSIIIPLFNKENSIARTVESVLNQSVSDFEVIIVDDGSTDNSRKEALSIKDSRIRLIEKENGGVSSARNLGIKAANSPYVALLDGDDYWDSAFLEEQQKLIDDFPEAGMWGVNYAFVKGMSCAPCDQGMDEGFRGYVKDYFGSTSHNDLYCSSSVVIKKDVFDSVGYFDERIASSEDLDMWYRIILRYPVVYYDKVLVYYNQNAENRVAFDTDTRFPLTKDIKYYIDKFNRDFDTNKDFSRYLNSGVAAGLLKDGYYFGTKEERHDADHVVSLLRYGDIHPKYGWIFRTPRVLGRLVYSLVLIKKSLCRR